VVSGNVSDIAISRRKTLRSLRRIDSWTLQGRPEQVWAHYKLNVTPKTNSN